MERRAKVELFEQLRREYEFGIGTIKGVADKFGVHRRLVRQAIKQAMSPERKLPQRESPKLEPVKDFIDSILESDKKAPRKQRHTAHRIYVRIKQELSSEVSEPSVRRYVRQRKKQMGLAKGEIFIPQSYDWGQEAQVDWYEAFVEMDGQALKAHFFSMRSMASGAAFHSAYPRPTQQAFFEAHQKAFEYFGGVFHSLRYDNLSSAVKKILRGHTREENSRFIAMRSHWRFQAEFCNPARGNEKGGVEGEVGFFRRNHLVPVPSVKDFSDLNRLLRDGCLQDQQRLIGQRKTTVSEAMAVEGDHLLPLPAESFQIAEVSFPSVDSKGCVRVRNNFYSTPVRAGVVVKVLIWPQRIEVCYEGKLVAMHQRCYERGQQILELEHYLDVLERKPGAFASSTPLKQYREQGRWPPSFDRMWESLQKRLGKQSGTREMIELLLMGRKHGFQQLREAVDKALEIGVSDSQAVLHLMQSGSLSHKEVSPLVVAALEQYEREQPGVSAYDQLLRAGKTEEVAR